MQMKHGHMMNCLSSISYREQRAFEARHASAQADIDYMRPRCVELTRVLKRAARFS